MDGIKVLHGEDGSVREVRYLTDDRDSRRRHELVIGWGNNGDWYVKTVPEGEYGMDAVRLCTSGGAAVNVPELTVAVARAFRAIARAAGEAL